MAAPTVFVLDRHGRPLQPCAPARARKLLAVGRAVAHRHTPFVVRLTDRAVGDSQVDGVEVGVDPGSKRTGLAVFGNEDGARAKPDGWLAPSLRHRVESTMSWVDRLRRWAPVTLACIPCNRAKGATPVEVFLADRPAVLARIMRQGQAPLRDAAAATSTRRALWRALADTGLPVAVATGGRTKWNRHRRTRTDRFGFPRLWLPRTKRVHGFATGDLVRAVVPAGLKQATHSGRVAVRSTGSFNIRIPAGLVQGIHHRHVRLLQRADGWAYTTQQEGEPAVHTPNVQAVPGFLPALKDRVSALIPR